MQNKIITIGHGKRSIEGFLRILKAEGIETVIDTRQFPVSRHNPSFNRAKIPDWLMAQGIQYVFLGNGLGDIQENILESRQDLKPIKSKSPRFKAFSQDFGRLLAHLNAPENVAILGTKVSPLECPRFYQLSPLLQSLGFSISHILEDDHRVPNWQLELELPSILGSENWVDSDQPIPALSLAYRTYRKAIFVQTQTKGAMLLNGPPSKLDFEEEDSSQLWQCKPSLPAIGTPNFVLAHIQL